MSACPGSPADRALLELQPRSALKASGLPALPSEILVAALEYLPQADLRRAAGVSRTIRAASKRAGLYIRYAIKWRLAGGIFAHLKELMTVIAHAVEYNCRVGIEFTCDDYVPEPPEMSPALEELMRETAKLAASIICTALRLLVFLRLAIPSCVRREFDAELCHPAPHLHTLELLECGIQGLMREAPFTPLPSDLFAGQAPRLRSVTLAYIPLPPAPILCFANVRRLHLQHVDVFPSMDVARHFPRMRDLEIEYVRECLPQPLEFDLRGLALHRLAIDTNDSEHLLPFVHGMLDLAAIPILEHQRDVTQYGITLDACNAADDECIGCAWPDTLPAADRLDLCARVSESGIIDEDVNIVVAPRRAATQGHGIRRLFVLRGWEIDEPYYPLFHHAPGLTYVRLDNTYLPGLLHSRLELPSLRELRVDLLAGKQHAEMLWPPASGITLGATDSDSECDCNVQAASEDEERLSCPALDALIIHAVDTPMRVQAAEAAPLGRALGHQGRARLVLCGVTFHGPCTKSQQQQRLRTVEQVFCAVEFTPFSGGCSLKERDDDIWSY